MKDRLLGTPEIMERTGCGRTQANEIMHLFEVRGQLYRVGNRLKVKEKVFNEWLERECRIPSLRERRDKRCTA